MPTTAPARRATRATGATPRARAVAGTRRKSRRSPGALRWLLGATVRLASATILPVVCLVGVAVELHARGQGAVASVAGGALAALVVLGVAATSIARSVTGRARLSSVLRWVALPAVLAWCVCSLSYLAAANAKTTEVREAYTSLHPVLRIAVATAILADGELVVTDARRSAADYRRMGLPVFDRTKHYPQENGWVHAVDVRTIGHGELRNWALAGYFRMVGLKVVRHVGTADHLHVELGRP